MSEINEINVILGGSAAIKYVVIKFWVSTLRIVKITTFAAFNKLLKLFFTIFLPHYLAASNF